MSRLLAVAGAVVAALAVALSPRSAQRRRRVPAGEVRFRAADGTRLVGRRFGRGTTAVVLAR